MGSGNMIVPSTYSSGGLHGAGGMAPAGEVIVLLSIPNSPVLMRLKLCLLIR